MGWGDSTISTKDRPQPPSINDPERSEVAKWTPGTENESGESIASDDQPDWEKRARDAYSMSTSYMDSNYRKAWEDSIRAFNNQHPGDSKYNTDLFKKRSQVYRPKTRAVIRKNEAAAAAAFFSNLDRTSINAQNQSDPKERLSAEVMQALVQYRLTKSIPWFQVIQGGLQDAQVQGAVVAHVHWRYETHKDHRGELQVKNDKPVIDLLPIENIRFDAAANWVDPINTSPYIIHLIPMYVCDVKDRMNRPDPKGSTWKAYDDSTLTSWTGEDDSTRMTRLQGQQDASQQKRYISDYDVVWIHRHIHRWNGNDYEFYTGASRNMITVPELLSKTVFHGNRPYIMGCAVLETHKAVPTSLPNLIKGLQDEANEVANQTLDNGKFILNKRWIVKRGKNVDLASLVRNVPGGITLADDIENDIKEVSFPELPSSAFAMQDRINVDIDDLAGNFSAGSVQMHRQPNQPAKAMTLLQAPSNLLTEYMLKTFVETFVQPILRHLVLLEQHYETDMVILSLAGQKAQAAQKYGVDKITDEILDKELVVTVNVGMGATDPVMKLQRFVYALNSLANFSKQPVPGIDLKEVTKEVFGLSGYQDGSRFVIDGTDPEKAKLMQQLQMAMAHIKQLDQKVKEKSEGHAVKLQTTRETNATKVLTTAMAHHNENKQLYASHVMALEQAQVPDPNAEQSVQ